jgi:GT2 family glycosyltransferase
MQESSSNLIQRIRRKISQAGIKTVLQILLHKLFPGKKLASPETTSSEHDDATYKRWIELNEPDPARLILQTKTAAKLAYTPLISILVPVYNPPLPILQQALTSVLAQTYAYWELCLVDGASTLPGVRDLLVHFSELDNRVHLKLLEENLGISGNSNQALDMAQGEFTAFLDQDDILAPFALFEIAQALNQDRSLDLLYSDHDLLEFDNSRRKQPLFKPDWSPEIMLSANYITHLTVVRTSLLRVVGGFDAELDGAQDWDLFLKISERTAKIAHIPKILYHWRDSRDSTASNIWAKDYAPAAQLRAIKAHLTRLGLSGVQAFFDSSGYIRVQWKFDRRKKVSIIIPSNGANPMLERCVHSILKGTDYPNFEIVIVNNGLKRPEEYPYYRNISAEEQVSVIHDDRPFNYSAVNNLGAQHASGELFLFLNNDTEIFAQDWLDELVMWAQREPVGIVGAKLLHPDGSIQHAGVIIGLTGFAGHVFGGQAEFQWTSFGLAEWYRDYKAVTAACMLIPRDVFEQLGGFDETFILCGSDVEICLRAARSGWRIVYNPFARLRHLEGATRAGEVPAQDFRVSYAHYLPTLRSGDPYFNPNLSYWRLKPTLAAPDEQSPLEFVLDFLKRLKGNGPNDPTE